LAVLPEQLVEQAAARGIGEGPEHCVHGAIICDSLVTCQSLALPTDLEVAELLESQP
jgi:hypothetical protein